MNVKKRIKIFFWDCTRKSLLLITVMCKQLINYRKYFKTVKYKWVVFFNTGLVKNFESGTQLVCAGFRTADT